MVIIITVIIFAIMVFCVLQIAGEVSKYRSSSMSEVPYFPESSVLAIVSYAAVLGFAIFLLARLAGWN